MKIEIPITDMEARELIIVLRRYPKGIVKVTEKKAVWITELDLSEGNTKSKEVLQKGQPGFTGKDNVFSNMAESITSAFGG